ncbi:MAG TPA: transglutaminase-like cysteine peptidase [Bradyrhizobium sp.]
MSGYKRASSSLVIERRRVAIKSVCCTIFVAISTFGAHAAPVARMQMILSNSTLPPVAHTIFCMHYPGECAETVGAASFFSSSAPALYTALDTVNRHVNIAIRPIREKSGHILTNRWLLSPLSGNCNDYAVSKRHELLLLGWPSWALLLAEVVLANGEHHLVLVANASGESFVLDNLKPGVVPLTEAADYRWLRIESPDDPKSWIAFDSAEPRSATANR